MGEWEGMLRYGSCEGWKLRQRVSEVCLEGKGR